MIRKALRDPLAHFLIAGAALWGLLAVAGDPVDPADRTITLTREQQAALSLQFERTMRRPPTDAELDAQIEQWAREEVLYREALRLGLDEGDPVVRRRLATKMDELAGAEVELARPTEDQLREWYRANGGAYETGGALDFAQAYFPTEEAAIAALTQDSPQGEPISLPRNVAEQDGEYVERLFGSQFAEGLLQLVASPEWQGPVSSGFGWHLVRLTRREEGKVPPFGDVRERVERDWRSRTIEARRQQSFQLLRDAYRVEIE